MAKKRMSLMGKIRQVAGINTAAIDVTTEDGENADAAKLANVGANIDAEVEGGIAAIAAKPDGEGKAETPPVPMTVTKSPSIGNKNVRQPDLPFDLMPEVAAVLTESKSNVAYYRSMIKTEETVQSRIIDKILAMNAISLRHGCSPRIEGNALIIPVTDVPAPPKEA